MPRLSKFHKWHAIPLALPRQILCLLKQESDGAFELITWALNNAQTALQPSQRKCDWHTGGSDGFIRLQREEGSKPAEEVNEALVCHALEGSREDLF